MLKNAITVTAAAAAVGFTTTVHAESTAKTQLRSSTTNNFESCTTTREKNYSSEYGIDWLAITNTGYGLCLQAGILGDDGDVDCGQCDDIFTRGNSMLTLQESFVYGSFDIHRTSDAGTVTETWMDVVLATLDGLCDAAEISNTADAETPKEFQQERGKCHTCYFAEHMTVGSVDSCNYAKYQAAIMLDSAATPYSEAMARKVDYFGWHEGDHETFLASVVDQLKMYDGLNGLNLVTEFCNVPEGEARWAVWAEAVNNREKFLPAVVGEEVPGYSQNLATDCNKEALRDALTAVATCNSDDDGANFNCKFTINH